MPRRMDHLHRSAVGRGESRAQDFMPPHNYIEASFQRDRVKPAVELEGVEKIVSRGARLQLIEEPEPLLAEGGGEK